MVQDLFKTGGIQMFKRKPTIQTGHSQLLPKTRAFVLPLAVLLVLTFPLTLLDPQPVRGQ